MESPDILGSSPPSLPQLVFHKRSLTIRENIRFFAFLFKHLPHFKAFLSAPSLSHQLQERIMLAVTSVNDCRYCSFFHTKIALESGCNEEEIQSILDQDLCCADEEEFPALAFAQHFAESHENPSRATVKRLVAYYGVHKTRQIIASCWMITLGNLYGNTVDAYQSRLLGAPAQSGNAWFEGFLYYLTSEQLTPKGVGFP
ncbi:MAG: carboxymuconolactone decarboxylase family protein [Promethearchaeota archaeon]